MTPVEPHADALQPAPGSGLGHAGAMLRDAREAAGLSIEAVSQQLKLAPRQVRALEDGDFSLLPGRTFVRGFTRNYARLLHLDPDTIVEALTGAPTEGGLEAPPLHATAITMGELPSNANGRPGWLRWAVPAVILVLVAGGIVYEYLRGDARGTGNTGPAAPSTSSAPSAPVPPQVTEGTVALPNPVAPGTSAPEPGPVASPTTDAAAPTGAGTDAAAIAPLSIALRSPSWVEIKDSTGRVVLSQTMAGGQTQAVVGTPPFDVVIGNASEVTVTYRGRPVDLAPYTRQNVARVTLQ